MKRKGLLPDRSVLPGGLDERFGVLLILLIKNCFIKVAYRISTKMESLRKKIRDALLLPSGSHIIYHNSFYPLTYNQVRALVPAHIDFSLSKRKFWNDIAECKVLHFIIVVLTGGLVGFVYIGFWLYEKWKPLYIITISDGYNKNPLFNV